MQVIIAERCASYNSSSVRPQILTFPDVFGRYWMINPCCTETSCCKSTNGDLQRARQLIGIVPQVGEGVEGALATYHLFLALSAILVIYGQVLLGKTSMKKNVFFRALPESPKLPPPLTPIWATWSSFYGSRNSRFESQFRTKNTIYTI